MSKCAGHARVYVRVCVSNIRVCVCVIFICSSSAATKFAQFTQLVRLIQVKLSVALSEDDKRVLQLYYSFI